MSKAAAKMLTTFSFPGKNDVSNDSIALSTPISSSALLYDEEASLYIVSFLTAKIGKSIPAAVQFDSLHFF